ncbi:uncharacterized protein BX664DRAFT_359121 [Halteromyces radiatus]|uniref:uncharacterized protein n=1 Tax=Halteromyces radiatus TaxID=101107 RepID=UPI00221E9550|nr:uncharacterized protein BX664DRAFT_359121 [Halteromyces radiatus]KAI8089582.1 hypothetical protein BX664DRAFT_359121 [Halteromyces radiatus]
MSVNDFLDSVKSKLETKLIGTIPILVTGNDSADLDSIISAVLLAYLKQQQVSSSNTLYIPLVKVPFRDLALRPEVTYVFNRAGINATKLICIDHVDLSYWKNNNNKLDIILVDHNRLTPPLEDLGQHCQVIGVVDHHVDEGVYLDASLRWIEMVGSCTSQVVLIFKEEITRLSNKQTVATLALAPILVDTIGLRWALGKTTQKDMDAFNIIGPLVFGDDTSTNGINHQEAMQYYDDIEKIKSQVDHLCTRDLLRKDYKEWTINGYTVGTSSISWYFKAWIDRDGYDQLVKDVWAFVDERQLDMLLILSSYDHSKELEDGVYERELAFFVKNHRLINIKESMERDLNVGLSTFLSVRKHDPCVEFYNQRNIKLSRKQIWPLVQDLLLKLE